MNAEKQISRLESLLARIRGNATKPRATSATRGMAPTQPTRDASPPQSVLPDTARADVKTPVPPVYETPPPIQAANAAVAESGPPAELEELDMMDAEIVELGAEAAAAPVPDPFEADLSDPNEEAVPESAPRPAAQAASDAVEREVPLKTPPPESGRQVMAMGAPQVAFHESVEADLSGGSEVDSLLEADLSGGPISKAPPGLPTMEQLGETVELEGADGPPALLELANLSSHDHAEPPLDDLELALPKKEFSGGYEETLELPADAVAELRRDQSEAPREASLSPAAQSDARPEPAPVATKAERVPAEPLVVERPVVEAAMAAEIVVEKQPRLPETFLELLDASLGLTAKH